MPGQYQNASTPCSTAELLARWVEVGNWSVEEQHGAAAKLVLMFALSLQRPTSAHSSRIQYKRPCVWVVSTPYGTITQRVSLLDDNLVWDLLNTIDATEECLTPVFPKTPCGSRGFDVWAHAMASRKGHRGMKNFVALLTYFDLPALKSPSETYQLSLSCFTNCFKIDDGDRRTLLASQQGCKRTPPALRLYWQPQSHHVGELSLEGQETYFVDRAGKPL